MKHIDPIRQATGHAPRHSRATIELGRASRETKGPPGGGSDAVGLLIKHEGLSHD